MPLVVEMPGRCPKCGGRIMKRTGTSKKTGKQYTYYCCEHMNSRDESAKCDFMTWDVPTDEVCPQCGKSLFKKRGNVLVCLDEKCGFSKPAPKKKKEQAEE